MASYTFPSPILLNRDKLYFKAIIPFVLYCNIAIAEYEQRDGNSFVLNYIKFARDINDKI